MNRIFLATVAVAGIALCQGLTAAAPSTCSLVSATEAAQALGGPIAGVTTRNTGYAVSCNYHAKALARGLVVTTVALKSIPEAKRQFQAMVASPMTQVAPARNLPSIGDEAQRLGPSIYVRKGLNIYVFTMIAKDGNGAGAQQTIALAKASIARLR